MNAYDEGTKVKWKWGNGYGSGTVQSSFTEKVTRKISGEEITRNGSRDNPAYYIQVEDGNYVLKLHSELEKEA